MSEGKYPRMPKPKDRRHIALEIGEVELKPETRDERKAREYDEEDDVYVRREKKSAPESMLSKATRAARELAGQASGPWSRLMKKDDDE